MEREEIERRVINVICHVLNVEPDMVTLESDFVFDLGAESRQSIELIAAFEAEFDSGSLKVNIRRGRPFAEISPIGCSELLMEAPAFTKLAIPADYANDRLWCWNQDCIRADPNGSYPGVYMNSHWHDPVWPWIDDRADLWSMGMGLGGRISK